jgi:hypothetical protein
VAAVDYVHQGDEREDRADEQRAGEEEPEADEADSTHSGAAAVTPEPDCGHPTAEQCRGGDDYPFTEAEGQAARQGQDGETR